MNEPEDPQLQAAVAEIQEVLSKRRLAGIVVIATPKQMATASSFPHWLLLTVDDGSVVPRMANPFTSIEPTVCLLVTFRDFFHKIYHNFAELCDGVGHMLVNHNGDKEKNVRLQ